MVEVAPGNSAPAFGFLMARSFSFMQVANYRGRLTIAGSGRRSTRKKAAERSQNASSLGRRATRGARRLDSGTGSETKTRIVSVRYL